MGRATPLGPWESSDWLSRGPPKKLIGAKNSHAGKKSDVILRCRSAKVAVRPTFSRRWPISTDDRVVRHWATPRAPHRERRSALHPERLVVADCRSPLDLTNSVVVQRIIAKPAPISSRFHSRQSHLAGPTCERPVKVLRCSLKGARERNSLKSIRGLIKYLVHRALVRDPQALTPSLCARERSNGSGAQTEGVAV